MKIYHRNTILFILLFMVGSTCTIIAQERYRVTYDYKTEQISYLKLDKTNKVIDTLDQPRLKRNSNVEIQLKNINPFAVKVVTDVREEELTKSGQGFNFSSLLGGINSFSGNSLDLNTSTLPDSDMFSNTVKSRGAMQKATSNFDDLNNTMTNVSALKTTLVSNPN